MPLETHLTLALPAGRESLLRDWAAGRGVKMLCIELASGVAPRQVMLTLHGDASVDEARRRAEALMHEVQGLCDAHPRRIKVESRWTEARTEATTPAYLEHHVRVSTRDLAALERLAAEHAAHLSRNAYKIFPDGIQERFLTQRFGASDTARMDAAFHALLSALRREGFPVTKVERECVLFDDNLALDEGWLKET
ncbi:hypothetical protein [Comamonas sp. JC664]|uniref:hypothetical protein n=1 Tax=Comamonas sp. JC664 TaxID=2801917 RepID=UPI00174AC3EC|nr:hypothetical protein [Comamonas sp. JC664]MBL0697975.1 hypothetical protein [Comamonas sp. JC664]GHG70621.1 hypothetical protein GCM10012319_15740 [Comamonas sp. KCTC 72670]